MLGWGVRLLQELVAGEHPEILAAENPVQIALALRLGGRVQVRLRDGYRFDLDGREPSPGLTVLALSREGATFSPAAPVEVRWEYDGRDRTVTTPTGVRLFLDGAEPVVLYETFLYGVHFAGFRLDGSTVVDAGANIGDTALYYAREGARVVAYEPDPENFRRLQRNLDANPGLRDRVIAHEEAVGVDGEVEFTAGRMGASGLYAQGGQRIRVRSVDLEAILRENKIDAPYLLKADCKGAEFDLVRQPAIRRFPRLLIEYDTKTHHGTLPELLAALRGMGFDRTRVFKHEPGRFFLRDSGTVYAEQSVLASPAGSSVRPDPGIAHQAA